MSETIMLRRQDIGRTRTPAVAAALISLAATAEILQALSKTLPTGGLALLISEALAILSALVASVLVSRGFRRIR